MLTRMMGLTRIFTKNIPSFGKMPVAGSTTNDCRKTHQNGGLVRESPNPLNSVIQVKEFQENLLRATRNDGNSSQFGEDLLIPPTKTTYSNSHLKIGLQNPKRKLNSKFQTIHFSGANLLLVFRVPDLVLKGVSFHSPNWTRLGESNLRNLSGTKQVHNEAGKNGGFLGGWGGGVGWSPIEKKIGG